MGKNCRRMQLSTATGNTVLALSAWNQRARSEFAAGDVGSPCQ